MKRLALLIPVLFIVAIPALIYTQTMSDYCSAPPYVTRTVPPNITLVLDNSKSMLAPAYTEEYNRLNPGRFIGYFKTNKTYCASSSQFYEAASCSGSDKGPYPGGLLNWATMSKYDIVMLILIGGKGTPTPSSRDKLKGENMVWPERTTGAYPGCTFTLTSQGGLKITSNGSCELQPITGSNGTPVVVAVSDFVANVSPRGIIQRLVDKNSDGSWDTNAYRIGIMRFQASQDDIKIDYCVGDSGPMSSFMNGMASDQSKPNANDSSAPFGLAMLRTIQYYKNTCSTICNPCRDPMDSVLCRKNFVLAISSGEATDVPLRYSAESLNEAIRLAHTSDIRSDINGTQVINFYNVHILGSTSGGNILKSFSKYGGFVDSNSNQQPDSQPEWDKDNNGLPDTYYEAADASEIQSTLEKAFQDILAQAASGTAVSVLASSSRGVGSVIQAYFLPARYEGTREIGWTGYMHNIWIDPADNLREDTESDYNLILDQDKVMKLYFDTDSNETKAAFFTTDVNGRGGTLSTCSSSGVKPFSNITSVWEAGKKLALRAPSNRIIFTSKKVTRGTAETHNFSGAPYPEFNMSMNTDLLNALNADATYTAEKIVRYIRGECLERGVQGDTACGNTTDSLYRDRALTVDGSLRVWKLGDIVSSTPKISAGTPQNTYHIDYGDRTYYDYISSNAYKQKSSVGFVGANDGMLHAFRVGYLKDTGLATRIKALFKNFFGSDDTEHNQLGEELWAYIPFNAFPYLKYLADPDYCHIYYSDLSVRVVDVSTKGTPDSTRTGSSWQTILLGGMRFGGACSGADADPSGPPITDAGFSSYFAIDVTDSNNPVPLWEFSDADMGYATTFPSVIRTGVRDENGYWYVAFGSGSKVLPKGGVDIGRNSTGHIYILNLKTGELVKKIALDHNAVVGDILAVDEDKNYSSEKIYFGTSYFSSGWKGKLVRIDIPDQDLSSSWTPAQTILFSGNYPFTASPDAAKDTRGNVWVFLGSGKYYSDLDEADTSPQIFLGMIDRRAFVGEGALSPTAITTTGTVQGTTKVCAYDSSTKSFALQDVVTSVVTSSPPRSDATVGWKIPLLGGERVISRPLAAGGLVDFLTYIPDVNPCRYGGDSFLYSVGYTTGLAPSKVAILAPEATTGTKGTVEVKKNVRLGPGAPPTGEAIIVPPPKEGIERLKKKIQVASGVIVEAEDQTAFSVVSKIIHRLKK